MGHLLYIGVGGFFGAISRYLISGWTYTVLGDRWAWGTLAVNVLGSFLLGILMTQAQRSVALPAATRDALTIGFLGALTTFSTFSWETMQYVRSGALLLGGLNIAANCVLCLLAVAAGIAALSHLS